MNATEVRELVQAVVEVHVAAARERGIDPAAAVEALVAQVRQLGPQPRHPGDRVAAAADVAQRDQLSAFEGALAEAARDGRLVFPGRRTPQ